MLSLYFDPDNTPEARAAIREEFVRALATLPDWAVQRAFDRWTKTGQRRPSPGEIVLLAEREIQPFTDELSRRRKIGEQMAQIGADRPRVTPEAAARIMAEAGFTEDRLAGVARKKHWTDAVPAGAQFDPEVVRAAKEGLA